jgi:hypothetical protein
VVPRIISCEYKWIRYLQENPNVKAWLPLPFRVQMTKPLFSCQTSIKKWRETMGQLFQRPPKMKRLKRLRRLRAGLVPMSGKGDLRNNCHHLLMTIWS